MGCTEACPEQATGGIPLEMRAVTTRGLIFWKNPRAPKSSIEDSGDSLVYLGESVEDYETQA